MKNVFTYYQHNLEAYTKRVESLRRKIHLYGTIRLLLVIAALVTVWLLRAQHWMLPAGTAFVYVVPFIVLMRYHSILSDRKSYAEALIKLCQDEISGLNYDFSAFDGAPDKIDATHPFSLDLDLFGEKSFFQSVNRTVTHPGRELLAEWIQHPLTDKDRIQKRQEAVRELAALSRLRQHFYVTGILQPGDRQDAELLAKLMVTPVSFAGHLFWELMVWIVPAVWVFLFVGLGLGFVPAAVFGAMFGVSFLVAYSPVRKVNALHGAVSRMEKIFATYARLMKSIEGDVYQSGLLTAISHDLVHNRTTASQAIRKLSSHIGVLDQRGTLTAILLNGFTFRDIRACISLEKWKSSYGKEAPRWLDALARFDAISSLAGFSFNHPQYIYPVITDNCFMMQGKALGHPLIHRDVCVKNDLSIGTDPRFMIITGANMAGKSTYLRTVGINLLLSCTGAPVCADELTVYPAGMVTSLRTSDSLTGNESYFFAELKRLKMIIDRLREGRELFIILDEILKGTNSVDKQKGSFALLRQLLRYKTCGIVATHDLALGALEEEFPGRVKNFRFEAGITQEELTFTYTLCQGIARNMNASFLMKKMGITL